MTDGLADTSIFVARESGRPVGALQLPERLAVSMITIGELHSGVLSAPDVETRDRRLRTLVDVLQLDAIPIDRPVAEAWARLQVLLRDTGLRLPINDSWIAATALAHAVPLVTQDRDYVSVPGLEVIHI